jgi:glutathione S-transferase
MAPLLLDRDRRAFELIEARLGEVPYLAGQDFTAADLINFFPLTTMRAFVPKDLSAYPNIRAYLKRIGDRPAYRKAMELGDPNLPLNLE